MAVHHCVLPLLWPSIIVADHHCALPTLWPPIIVPSHYCGRPSLCPPIIVASHYCALPSLCPPIIVADHHCGLRLLCPPIIVLSHHCGLRLLWPTIIVPSHHCALRLLRAVTLGRKTKFSSKIGLERKILRNAWKWVKNRVGVLRKLSLVQRNKPLFGANKQANLGNLTLDLQPLRHCATCPLFNTCFPTSLHTSNKHYP